MAKIKLGPEYIALLFTIAFSSMVFMGFSAESSIEYFGESSLNFNYLSMFFLGAPIFFDIFMYKFYQRNHRYFKFLLPYSVSKLILIDVLTELFSHKLLFIISFLVMYFPFCYTYKLNVFGKIPLIGFTLIILMYINSCLIIRLIKDVIKNKVNSSQRNFFKLFSLLLFILIIINDNTKFLNFEILAPIYILIKMAIVLILILIPLLYLININNDKI